MAHRRLLTIANMSRSGGTAQPEEIAKGIAFLASERASFMVGSIAMTDGGKSVVLPA